MRLAIAYIQPIIGQFAESLHPSMQAYKRCKFPSSFNLGRETDSVLTRRS